jgi:hypothetical protein
MDAIEGEAIDKVADNLCEAIAWTVGTIGVLVYATAVAFRLFSLGQSGSPPDILDQFHGGSASGVALIGPPLHRETPSIEPERGLVR